MPPWRAASRLYRWRRPGRTAALAILQGLAPRYESYHGVHIEPQALEDAVELTAAYMPGRFLPDKAIDALDEACASVKMEERCPPAVGRADVAEAVARAQRRAGPVCCAAAGTNAWAAWNRCFPSAL